jgi:hypothetical protein
MSRDLGDLAVSLSRAPSAIREGQRKGVQMAALKVTTEIRDATRRDTGGDSRMSGVGKSGAKLGARFKMYGGENPTAYITATGPYHLLERNTSSRFIIPRGWRVSRRYTNLVKKGKLPANGKVVYLGGAKALKFGGRFSMTAEHPGTRGKHTFERSWKRAAPKTPEIFQREVTGALRKAWF